MILGVIGFVLIGIYVNRKMLPDVNFIDMNTEDFLNLFNHCFILLMWFVFGIFIFGSTTPEKTCDQYTEYLLKDIPAKCLYMYINK